MSRRISFIAAATSLILVSGVLVLAQDKAGMKESERRLTEADVPPAALAALKKLAGGAPFTEIEEEMEHGSTHYEAEWNGPDGEVEATVTAEGDLVEFEEVVPDGKVSAAARAAAQKAAGEGAVLKWEKTTVVYYEVSFKKDGKSHELYITLDGRRLHDDDDGHDHEDHDDGDHDHDEDDD